jgi:transposase
MVQRFRRAERHKSSAGGVDAKPLEVVQPKAAGIDIGASSHWVRVPAECDEQPVRFGCYTPDLQALVAWLQQGSIGPVAMASPGVDWIALFELLESAGIEVILVNAQHLKHVPGRKSDGQDCQWLRPSHRYGLLSASFRPAEVMGVLRSYLRQRDPLIADATRHIQRMQKALSQMKLHLHRVLSAVTGWSGMRILKAIVTGERVPHMFALLKHERVKATDAEIAAALSGNYWEEHLFVLQQALVLYESYQQQIAA